MNQSFDFEFLCENFQPKLINSYSNFKRFFHFLLCDLGCQLIFSYFPKISKNKFQEKNSPHHINNFLQFSILFNISLQITLLWESSKWKPSFDQFQTIPNKILFKLILIKCSQRKFPQKFSKNKKIKNAANSTVNLI
jgi:hypothetical protein